MTTREQLVLRAMVRVLSRMDQCDETVLHHAIGQLVPDVLWSELIAALRAAEQNRWVVGVKGMFENNKWAMTDLGRAAGTQM